MKDQTLPVAQLPGASVVRALKVSIIAGPDAGMCSVIEKPSMMVGRGLAADVRIQDRTVSEFHLELSPHKQGIAFSDHNSRNGVRVGGVLVERGIAQSGCVFTLGMTKVCVELAGEYPAPAVNGIPFGKLIGQSEPMRRLYAQISKLAATDLTVLIQGATGTGKELVARSLHDHGARRGGPYLVLDCTTLGKELAPSRLFGHEKGAFTGAIERKSGVFEAAHGGTVFLDEISDLPLDVQPMLLRVLESREIIPVGSNRPKPVNVRILCATWRDLRTLVNRELFRSDLYHRLATHGTVFVPSLDERRDDIPLLIRHFLAQISIEDQYTRSLTDEALDVLTRRTYPGNIRELRHAVECAAALAEGPTITLQDLAEERSHISSSWKHDCIPAAGPTVTLENKAQDLEHHGESIIPFKEAKRIAIAQFEKPYLAHLMALTNNNLSQAAHSAHLERQYLRELLRRHGLYKQED